MDVCIPSDRPARSASVLRRDVSAASCLSTLPPATPPRRRFLTGATVAALGLLTSLLGQGCASVGQNPVALGGPKARQLIVSVRDQKLTVVRMDGSRLYYPISTSKFGLGDHRRHYETPVGNLEIAQKVGGGAPPGAVFKGRVRTGEVIAVNAPGRDPIVTRILALRGLEPGNRDALSRGIYIHGTPEESTIGTPSSFGCIRMRSRDVIELYDIVNVGTRVQILDTTRNQALSAYNATIPPDDRAPQPSRVAASSSIGGGASQADEAAAAVNKPGADADEPSARSRSSAGPTVVTTTPGRGDWAGSPSRLLGSNGTPAAAPAAAAPAAHTRGTARNPDNRPAANDTSGAPNNREDGRNSTTGRNLKRPVLDSL